MPNRIQTDEQLDKEVLFILSQHVGAERAIDRWELVTKIYGPVAAHLRNDGNPQDRLIRDSVSRLRGQGHFICDLGNGKGRYIANTEDEFWQMYTRYVKPLKSGFATARAMKAAAKVKWPNLLQMSLFTMDDAVLDEVEMSL